MFLAKAVVGVGVVSSTGLFADVIAGVNARGRADTDRSTNRGAATDLHTVMALHCSANTNVSVEGNVGAVGKAGEVVVRMLVTKILYVVGRYRGCCESWYRCRCRHYWRL